MNNLLAVNKVLAADEVTIPRNPTTGNSIIDLSRDLTVGEIISKLLPYIFVIAGLVLLFMLIMGGIGLMTSGGNPDKTKAGYGRITHALIGFLIIFVAYFVAQLVQIMLGVKFL